MRGGTWGDQGQDTRRPENGSWLERRMYARDLQPSGVKDQLEFITEALKRKIEGKRRPMIIPQ